jgi:hypothetical protein
VTDGFEFYGRAVSEVIGKECLYAQVIKTRRNNRVVKSLSEKSGKCVVLIRNTKSVTF